MKKNKLEVPQTNFLISVILSLLAETERLKSENAAIQEEKADLEMMMEMASLHADEMGSELLDKVDDSIKEIEDRVRLISETIPVPVIISRRADGKFLYVNEHSCNVFGLCADEFLKHNAIEIYEDASQRQEFINILNDQERVSNFHVRLKKWNGELFWADLFSQPLDFKNESCVLTVIYDLTERRQAEEEIRRLTEELERKKEQREKYLMFRLAGEEYGIHLPKIKEIIGMTLITPVFNAPDFIKGVANLRGRVIPIADLRLRLGLKAANYTDRTCIIVSEIETETEKRMMGIIVDSVIEVLGIKGKYIDPPPEIGGKIDMRFIFGMAKLGKSVKILLDMENLWQEFHISVNNSSSRTD